MRLHILISRRLTLSADHEIEKVSDDVTSDTVTARCDQQLLGNADGVRKYLYPLETPCSFFAVPAAELNRKAPGTSVDEPCANRDTYLMSSDYSEVVTVVIFYTGHKGSKHLKMVRRLTRDIVLLFIVMLAIVVCLQFGFYIYTNFFSWRFLSPTSSLRQFYKELGNKRELGNAKIQTTTTIVTPYAHFNAKSNWNTRQL